MNILQESVIYASDCPGLIVETVPPGYNFLRIDQSSSGRSNRNDPVACYYSELPVPEHIVLNFSTQTDEHFHFPLNVIRCSGEC